MTVARAAAPLPTVVAFLPREKARAAVRAAFPRRRARLVVARTAQELDAGFRAQLVDAVLVDVSAADDETWKAAQLTIEFPLFPFFGFAPLRVGEGPALAQCAQLGFADLLVDGVDDGVLRDLVIAQGFSSRFAEALREPPPSLGLATTLQQQAWSWIVSQAGRPVRTSALAESLGITREHLSRSFAAATAPNLKRVIDLVRLLAAAELAKNPGYDVRDVASVLGYASSSHLSSTAQRVVGTKPSSLSRLRAVDLVERFAEAGRGRSRG